MNHVEKLYSGDIGVSEKTVHKLMKTSNDSNSEIWKAFPDSRVDIWDQNFVNGEYKVPYELNSNLHPKLKSMLPQVRFHMTKIMLRRNNALHIVRL